ncbi:MAG: M16 family metallopeptidase [Chthonomonadales bacterium]
MLIREHHAVPLVAIDLWIRAGSSSETEEEHGAAHFLEHLIFKGTPTRKPGEIDTAFEDLGATLSAGTTRDAAHFYATVSSAHVADALPVLADAIMHPLLDPQEVERERGVILDELARSSNDVRKEVLDRLFATLFPGTPYASPVLGTPQAIRTVTRAAILRFYGRWYHPNNATLVFCGDITPDAAEALAAKCFGSWKQMEVPALPAVTAQPRSQAVSAQSSNAPAIAALGFPCPPATDVESAAAMEIFARAATLHQGLDRFPGQASAINVTFISLRQASLLALDAPPEGSRGLPALWDWLRSCIDKMTDEDVETARRELLGEYLYQIETEGGMAAALGRFDTLGDYRQLARYTEKLQTIPPTEVRAAARRLLTPARAVQIVMEPPSKP